MGLRARGGRTGWVGVLQNDPPAATTNHHLHLHLNTYICRVPPSASSERARSRVCVCGGLETSRVESNSCTLRCIRGHAAANGRAAVTRTARRVAAAAAARHAPSMDTSGGGTGRGAHKKTRSLCRRVFAAAMGVNARKFCGGPASCVAAIN